MTVAAFGNQDRRDGLGKADESRITGRGSWKRFQLIQFFTGFGQQLMGFRHSRVLGLDQFHYFGRRTGRQDGYLHVCSVDVFAALGQFFCLELFCRPINIRLDLIDRLFLFRRRGLAKRFVQLD